jgi:hypothetical protein
VVSTILPSLRGKLVIEGHVLCDIEFYSRKESKLHFLIKEFYTYAYKYVLKQGKLCLCVEISSQQNGTTLNICNLEKMSSWSLRCQAEEDAAIVMIQATCNMIEIDDNK